MKRCPSCQSSLPTDYTHCPRDGSTLVAVAEWAEGAVIRGKYRIMAKVGEGGMASVYKAMHTRFNEVRALKVISAELASDVNFVRRFEQEAIVTRKLQHPNAVRVDDIDEAEDGRPFIVMEFVEGRSLKEVIEREAPMSLPRVSAIVQQTAAALDAAHAVGLVHRDIKPGNIALAWANDATGSRTEVVKVLDFGIAKLREARLDSKTRSVHLTLTDTGMMIGTPAYMSPEQARGMRGDELDGRSDFYSLGVVMYQMLSGDLPLKADSTLEQLMAHLNTAPRPIREVRPDIPAEFETAVMRCLEKNRDYRPANGAALIRELQWASSRPVAVPVPPMPPPKLSEPAPPYPPDKTTAPIAIETIEDETAPLGDERTPESTQDQPPAPSRAWLWVAVVVLVVVAGASIAYFRRGPTAAPQTVGESAADATKSEMPPQPERSDSTATPNPPSVPHGSVEPPATQPKSSAVRTGSEVPQLRSTPGTVPASGKTGTVTTPLSASSPSTNMNTPAPGAVAGPQKPVTSPQVSAPSSPKLPDPGTPFPPANSSQTTNPPTTQPAAAAPAASGTAASSPTPGTETLAVYRVGGGVSAPSIVSARQPDYTDEASRVHKEGKVVLSLIVDTAGRARNLRVVSPLGYGLDEKAIQAVQQWRFQPGMKDGKPVNVQLNIEVEFRQY